MNNKKVQCKVKNRLINILNTNRLTSYLYTHLVPIVSLAFAFSPHSCTKGSEKQLPAQQLLQLLCAERHWTRMLRQSGQMPKPPHQRAGGREDPQTRPEARHHQRGRRTSPLTLSDCALPAGATSPSVLAGVHAAADWPAEPRPQQLCQVLRGVPVHGTNLPGV